MGDLVTWLREQIAEDERVARTAAEAANGWGRSAESWAAMTDKPWRYWDADEAVEHISTQSPARVLAQCEAHRAILDQYDERFSDAFIWHPILRALALAYQDRPGFREEWRPR